MNPLEETRRYFMEKHCPKVLQVQSSEGSRVLDNYSCVSGFFVSRNGFILTISSIFPPNATYAWVRTSAGENPSYRATLVRSGPIFSLLKVDTVTHHPFLQLSPEYQICQEIASICHPGLLIFTCNFGLISYESRSFEMLKEIEDQLLISSMGQYPFNKKCCVFQVNGIHGNKGCEGAPILNMDGRVIGVYGFYSSDTDFAFKGEDAILFLEEHLAFDAHGNATLKNIPPKSHGKQWERGEGSRKEGSNKRGWRKKRGRH